MDTEHTPRLCIDGRVASELKSKGLIAQEVIDQLVAGRGEGSASSEWIEKHRTVLLTHPNQVFSGQLRRFDTKRKIGFTPLSWIWEKNFIKNSSISAFHRFRPIDRVKPTLSCPTLTTLLPAKKSLPFFLSRRPNQKFIVPSEADASFLYRAYEIEPEQVLVHKPAVRRYIRFVEKGKPLTKGTVLFLVGDKDGKDRLNKLAHVISERYPSLKKNVLYLKDSTDVTPLTWMKLLQEAKLCFYLTSSQFDWATLALEASYWNVPLIFSDGHGALNELLPHSSFRLSQFLINLPELIEMKLKAQSVYLQLDSQGAFEPYAFAEQYRKAYEGFLAG